MKKIWSVVVSSILLAVIFSNSGCNFIDSVVKKQGEKNGNLDEKINRILQEGANAYKEKNYELALKKFDEGFNVNPTFPRSAPVFLNNKAQTLISRGTETYNQSLKSDQAMRNTARESAKKDFEEAIYASENALEILKNAVSEFVDVQKHYETNTLTAFTNRKNACRLLAQTGADRTRGKEAVNVFREYLGVETDPTKKSKAQLELALTLQDSNEFLLAITEFRKILETDPNNVDALAGIGLNLTNVGYANAETDEGKEQLKEAARYLEQYLAIAPETHKFKQEAQGIIDSLRETQSSTKTVVKKNASRGKTNQYRLNQAEIADSNSVVLTKKEEK